MAMEIQTIIIFICVLATVLAGLYIFIICTEIAQVRRTKVEQLHMQTIRPDLESILAAPDFGYDELYSEYVTAARKNIKNKAYRNMLEMVLLEHLEKSGEQYKKRALCVSCDLGFPSLCLSQIKSRNNRNVAFGCRKAGLYQHEEAIPYMLKALSIFSNDTQFQILMGLSRIGDVDAMCRAFQIISGYVIVNERAAFEILEVFSGDKEELYKRMIHCEEEYIATIFIKSLNQDIAKALVEDIVGILENGGKEMRIAAIKAIGKIGQNAPTNYLRNALVDDDWEVRAIAANVLGMQVDLEASKTLASALLDPEWWVRQNAALSLLSYPDCKELFLSVMRTKDAYARDSIVYALENAERLDMLAEIQLMLEKADTEKTEKDGEGILKGERLRQVV